MTNTDLIQFMVAMIIMLNPLGTLSIFMQLTNGFSRHQRHRISITAGIAVIIIMLVTLWAGKNVLSSLGITIPSFRVAGGIILLLMGLSMLQSRESPVSHTLEDDEAAKERESIAIVPLALPVIVGPGAMSTLIIAAGDYPYLINKIQMSVICILLGVSIGLILYFSNAVADFVGISVIKVVTRIMGMIIMAIAVGMLATGLTGLLPVLQ